MIKKMKNAKKGLIGFLFIRIFTHVEIKQALAQVLDLYRKEKIGVGRC